MGFLFSEPPPNSANVISKQTINHSQRQMQKWFSADAKNYSWQSKGGDWYELTRRSLPWLDLLFGFMPHRIRMLQQLGLCMAFQNSWQPALQHVEQPAWVPSGNNNTVDWHPQWMPKPRRLRIADDQQSNGRRLDEKNELQQGVTTPSKQKPASMQQGNMLKYFWMQVWKDTVSGLQGRGTTLQMLSLGSGTELTTNYFFTVEWVK